MRKIANACDKMVHLTTYFGLVALVGMMLLVVINIIMRKGFNAPILGVVELSQQLLACVVWLGMGFCALDDGMMSVDILKVSPTYMLVVKIITAITCGVSGVAAFISANASRMVGTSTAQLGIPKFIFQYVTAVGFFMVVLAIISMVIREYCLKPDAGAVAASESASPGTGEDKNISAVSGSTGKEL